MMRKFNDENELQKMLGEDGDGTESGSKKYYKVNGAIFINSMSELSEKTKFENNVMGYVLSKEHGIDIDVPEDVVVAEYYLSQKCGGEFLSFTVY